jgi:hypothetical protein
MVDAALAGFQIRKLGIVALALVASAGFCSAARAELMPFPQIEVWAYPGAYQDSTHIRPNRCVGAFQGPQPDSLAPRERTVTVRFTRDRIAEARRDFGGYRIYRISVVPDTTRAVLIRRFSTNVGSEITWNFSRVDTTTLEFMCNGAVVNDSIITFVDADSAGQFEKVCRRVDHLGRCLSIGDSVWKLVSPPGPHDGVRTWYSVTYEARNRLDNNYEDLYVQGPRDTLDDYARCTVPGDSTTCPYINLNNLAANVSNGTPTDPFGQPVEPTPGPTQDLQRVTVVPNPYRATEAWDLPGQHEVHFTNLPPQARIRIYTVAGDLVATIDHSDPVRDFARWNLKNQNGQDVASGIYMFRVETDVFAFQDRFVIIR